MRLLQSQQAHYEILIWEATNGLLSDFRSDRRRGDADAVDTKAAVFTEGDWPFLIRRLREILSLHIWIRFAALWFLDVLIGFRPLAIPSYSNPGAVFFIALIVWRVAPKWLSGFKQKMNRVEERASEKYQKSKVSLTHRFFAGLFLGIVLAKNW